MTSPRPAPDLAAPRPDGDLIAAVASGQSDALDAFYDAHVEGLYAFVFYRVGRDAALAEEVVQDTFLRALDGLDAFDAERGSILSWLCVLSRNVIRRHLTAAKRSQELLAMWDRIDDTLAQVFDALASTPMSDEIIERNETRDLVNMTVAHLPENYRLALERKYVAGDSLRDLARRLELTEDAAKSLLARARRAFRATFATLSQDAFGPQIEKEVGA